MFSFVFNWVKGFFSKKIDNKNLLLNNSNLIGFVDHVVEQLENKVHNDEGVIDNLHKLMYEVFEPLNRCRCHSGMWMFRTSQSLAETHRGFRINSEWNKHYSFCELNTPKGISFNFSRPFMGRIGSSIFQNKQSDSCLFQESKKYEEL